MMVLQLIYSTLFGIQCFAKDSTSVLVLNILCLVFMGPQVVYELIQLRELGYSYFKQLLNYVDMA